MKECFSNSQSVLMLGDVERRLTYAEGSVFGAHHGWLLIAGRVVDLTLRASDVGLTVHVLPEVRAHLIAMGADPNQAAPAPSEYFGVTFSTASVKAFVEKNGGAWGAMLLRRRRAEVVGPEKSAGR